MKDKQASAKHQASRCAMRPPYVARIPGCSLIALGRPERLGGSWVLPLVWFHILLLDGWADGWADGWTDMSQPVNQSVSQSVSQSNISPPRLPLHASTPESSPHMVVGPRTWGHHNSDGRMDRRMDRWTDGQRSVSQSVSQSASQSV